MKMNTEIQKINDALLLSEENQKNPQYKEGFLLFVGEEIRDLVDEISGKKVAEVEVPPEVFGFMTKFADLILAGAKECLEDSTDDAPAEEHAAFFVSMNAQKIGSLFLEKVKDEIPTAVLHQVEQIFGTNLITSLMSGLYEFEIPAPEPCIFDTETGEVTDMEGNAITGNAFTHNPNTGELISLI